MSREQSSAYIAERIIRRFASATNLLIASRTLRVHGEGPVAMAVSNGLTRMGARAVDQGGTAQLIFVVGDLNDADAVIGDAVASSAAWGSAVVVDGTTGSGIGPELARAFSVVSSPRRGLEAYSTGHGEVFLVDARFGEVEAADEAGYAPEPVSDAAAGIAKIAWAERFMPVTRALSRSLANSGAVRGLRIAVSLVLEPKTAVLALALADAGADVSVWCDADGTRNDVVAALRERGIKVFANGNGSARDDYDYALDILRQRPQLLIDDGSSLIRLAHSELPEVLDGLIGAAEETTSGLRPLRVMQDRDELKIPVIAVNDARCKTLFDNAYGTGQSCLMTILDLLDQPGLRPGIALAGSTVVVAGFGYVGTGVARHAAALGATVVVSEVDPVAALQAAFAGYRVAPLADAVASADLIIASTGIADTVTADALAHAKEGAAVAVAGGVDQEIAINDLVSRGAVRSTLAHAVERFQLPDGPGIVILDNGECINCTAGEGNPVEIMDLSFGVQLSALDYLLQRYAAAERGEPGLAPGVHKLPDSVDHAVSRASLAASGIAIDRATPAQQDFLHNWQPIRFVGFADGREYPEPVTPDSYPDLHSGPVTVYSAALVIPVTAPAIAEGAVAVSGRHILHVGTREWVLDSLDRQGRDVTETYWPGVLTPGLVNAHSHLQYTGMAEVGQGRYKGVDDWDEAFMPSYTQPHDWAADAAEGARRLIRSGQTSVADIVTDPEAISVLHDAGLHGITYWEVMGWENERWQAEGHGRVVDELARVPSPPGVGLSPHAPYSLDTQPLLDIPDIVRQRGLRIHIHLAESELEGSDLHPSTVHWPSLDARSFRSLREEHGLGISSTEFVDQLGLLGPDCHVAHGIYVTARDRALLRARGTSVALCPRSNAVIGLDAPPVADYLREGNPLAVGTDSLSSSPSLDLLADVAELYRLARAQGYHDQDLHSRLLSLATLGGAQAMGIGAGPDRVGYLAVGALADLAFFDVPVQTSAPQDSLAHLVEAGEGTARATVIEGQLRWAARGWPGGEVELLGESDTASPSDEGHTAT